MQKPIKEGVFRVTNDADVSWYKVSKTHYPRVQFWATKCDHGSDGFTEYKDTRHKLTDDEWATFETWL